MQSSSLGPVLAATLSLATLAIAPPTLAQVAADGTLSTRITSPDNRNFTIEDGDRAGGNLFHSFREFSVPTGGSAHFNNAADVQNIFSRVTGGTVSNIDGLIRANGGANLYLLNPAGILFGPNASLNIGGAFVGTTANSIRFGDGVTFSTAQTSGTPLLTVSAPVGLQLGANAGSIRMQGEPAANFFLRPRRLFQAQSVALVGSQIDMDSASLIVPDGRVELWAVQNAEVGLNNPTKMQLASSNATADWGTISLRNSSFIDTSGINGGAINIHGRGLTLQDGSSISSSTGAGGQGQGITVQTTEFANLLGVSAAEQYPTPGLYTSVSGNGARAGDITVETRQLQIANGGWLQSIISFGFDPITFIPFSITDSRTGDITVRASDVGVSGYNPFPANFFRPSAITTLITGGNRNLSGDITIDANRVSLLNGARISADLIGFSIPGFAESLTTGTSGNISIRADESLDIDGVTGGGLTGAVISSIQPFATGQAGNITIDTGRLRLTNGGTISSSVSGSGKAGNVDIRATDVSVSNPVIDSFSQAISGITVAVGENAIGQGGNVTLRADRLRVFNGGQILSSTAGQGDAGNITLRVGNMDVEGISQPLSDGRRLPSTIAASSTTAFDAGSVNITADSLQVSDRAEITTRATGSGNAGTLNLQVSDLSLNRGQIEVSSATGDAGQLTIQANTAQLNNRSRINASTQAGQGGDVQLQVRDRLQLNHQSQIVADAQQSGRGGNLSLSAAEIVLDQGSDITTNARGSATGGRLTLKSDRLSLANGSQITASTSGSGRAGSLNIHATDGITLRGNNTRLAAASTTNAAAGSIVLQTPQLHLSDRASISVSGAGQGGAGDLTVAADTLHLDQQAALEAEVAGGDQGNITLNVNRVLLLRHRSTITTNATGQASGGNISITSPFLIGLENSDIVAQAQAGAGGNINISANSVLGIAPRASLTPESDINASSQLGLNGSVSISNPDVKPDSGLVELPEGVVDSSQQIAQTCAATQASRFVATGRGGIPENPTQGLGSDRSWNDIRDLSAYLGSANAQATDFTSEFKSQNSSVVEATEATLNPQGQIELIATSESGHLGNTIPATCSPPPVVR
ncbi:MAG: filamentous hemagglutinin N-terminal domain-containing protein [Oscillatoriophycideae cyanobacterium NC_groundwater_1537_Pr4_S-0.65um_50_18]|nr:filamentous hemagglutinin N-terminal domain-containing protein [Oscillatoriophycideae cyanobacterium NC_groundwater_1537_Pr4_S-0.65um_50_18]